MSNLFIIYIHIASLFTTFQFFTLKVFHAFYQKLLLPKKYLNTTLLEMFGNLQRKFYVQYYYI